MRSPPVGGRTGFWRGKDFRTEKWRGKLGGRVLTAKYTNGGVPQRTQRTTLLAILWGGGIAESLDVGFVFLAAGGFLVPDVLGFADEMDRDAAILSGNAVGVGFFPG